LPCSGWSRTSTSRLATRHKAKHESLFLMAIAHTHCTHALQGLDVVCFARMKEHSLFGQAYRRAFTTESVEAAFRVTGVYPFDRAIITEKQMRPSEATSTRGTFAVTYTSPVHAIMMSFKTYRPTALEILPSNAQPPCPVPSQPTSPPLPEIDHTVQLPINADHQAPTPSPKRAWDPATNPSPETPSKRMRIMVSQIGATRSGSHLLSRAKITSSQPFLRLHDHATPTCVLPEPNWELIERPLPKS